MLVEEIGDHVISLDGFRKLKLIPERMRKRIEDDQLGFYSGVCEGAMQVHCAA